MASLAGDWLGKQKLMLLTLGIAWLLGACSESGGGSGRSLEIQEAALTVNGQAVKAALLSESAGEQSLQLTWQTRYSSPDREYRTRVYLGTSRFDSIEKLFEIKCGQQEGAACNTEGAYQCSLQDNVVDCRTTENGNRVYVDQRFTQVLMESCIYDPLLASYDKYACDTQVFELTLFFKDDPRLADYDGVIPAEWVTDGVPGNAPPDPDAEDDPTDGNADDTSDEETPLEDNPLYITLQENRIKWSDAGSDTYLYTLNTTCDDCEDEDVVVTVAANTLLAAFFTPSGQQLDAEQLAEQRTIEQWFDFIESVIKEADTLSVEYDEDRGFPTSIVYDPDANKRGDDFVYKLRDFQS